MRGKAAAGNTSRIARAYREAASSGARSPSMRSTAAGGRGSRSRSVSRTMRSLLSG
jgi:hypothetical protein